MQSDFSVEMGADDAALEVPWAAADGSLCYYNLREQPELLEEIDEARRFPELAEFLRSVNAADSVFESVKCDVWASTEMDAAEEVFGASHKHGSYCDIVFRRPDMQASFVAHESLARRVAELLSRVPEMPAAVECVVRRCYFHYAPEMCQGFALTTFVLGYGNDPAQARQRWAIAAELTRHALTQASHTP